MKNRINLHKGTLTLFLICILLTAIFAAGCSVTDNSAAGQAESDAQDTAKAQDTGDADPVFAKLEGVTFVFSSGAGAWDTVLQIAPDGTFRGRFHDSEMGDTGPDYPDGKRYECDFSGVFTSPDKIDDYTYSFRMESISFLAPKGQYTEDNILHELAQPYGLENAEEFYLYLPGKSSGDLPEEFLSWMQGAASEDDYSQELKMYGLYNISQQYGFAGYQEPYDLDTETSAALVADKIKATSEAEEDFEIFSNITVSLNDGYKTVSTDAFSFTLPDASKWDFRYDYVHGIFYVFSPLSIRYDPEHGYHGGMLVQLSAAESGNTWYREWGKYYELGRCVDKMIVANFPTDVQWDMDNPDAQQEYMTISEILDEDQSWFTLK